MKIGILSTTIYPLTYPVSGYQGIEKLVSEKSVELSKRGHEVTVFAPRGSKLPEPIKIVEVCEPSINYHYSYEKAAMDNVMKYLETNHIDILEENTHQKYAYTHYDKLKQLNIKLCGVLHNQCNFSNPPPGVPKMNLIGISDNHCNEAIGILGMHLEKVYNGINLNNYTYNENKQDYFLFLSRIARQKGAHEAIQACKETGEKLIVAGEDIFVQDPSYVMSIINSCDGKLIKYLGNVSENKKRELLSNAKALILPITWNEPFGIVVLEALASGTPVITAPRGAMTEIVRHRIDGYFCFNINEIKQAMKLVEKIKPQDCLERAKDFSIEKMTDGYLRLYGRILAGDEW